MNSRSAILLIHAAATLAMCGIIWFVQIVHYPMLAAVAGDGFVAYETTNMARTGPVVAPFMIIEVLTGLLLLRPPRVLPPIPFWTGGVLLALVWVSTIFVQIPLHNTLLSGFDSTVHGKLVATNWIRTGAWTIRGIFVLYALRLQMQPR